MPYIEKKDRPKFNDVFELGKTAQNEGELNYVLTQVCRGFLNSHDIKYSTFNSIIGALECCKIEFYRRLIEDYENAKIAYNGDVYSI